MNKYLQLAEAMYQNRLDWTDDYKYVKTALKQFPIENELDEAIITEINEILYEYDTIDGRHFRDCSFNYTVIKAVGELLEEE